MAAGCEMKRLLFLLGILQLLGESAQGPAAVASRGDRWATSAFRVCSCSPGSEQSCRLCHSQRTRKANEKAFPAGHREGSRGQAGIAVWSLLCLLFEGSSAALQDTLPVEYACSFDVRGLRFPGDRAD